MTKDLRFSQDSAPVSSDPGAVDGGPEVEDAAIPEDAFYNPDDPIAHTEGVIPEDAIFSPDGPIARQDEGVEGIVTGMAGEAEEHAVVGGDLAWQIRRTSNILESLSHALREQGMEALRVHPETEPMDAMLRSFVAGFLVGRLEGRE